MGPETVETLDPWEYLFGRIAILEERVSALEIAVKDLQYTMIYADEEHKVRPRVDRGD